MHLLAYIFVMLFVFLYVRAADCFGCTGDNERTAYLSFLGHGCSIFGATPHNDNISYFYGFMLWNSGSDVHCICCSDSDPYIYRIYVD